MLTLSIMPLNKSTQKTSLNQSKPTWIKRRNCSTISRKIKRIKKYFIASFSIYLHACVPPPASAYEVYMYDHDWWQKWGNIVSYKERQRTQWLTDTLGSRKSYVVVFRCFLLNLQLKKTAIYTTLYSYIVHICNQLYTIIDSWKTGPLYSNHQKQCCLWYGISFCLNVYWMVIGVM